MTTDNTDPREPNEPGTAHINPGDKELPPEMPAEEKGEKTAVAYEDMFGNPVEEPDGSKKALHHVKDAEEISDVIRQARVNEKGERIWN
jgi:hypothetical protein